MGFHCWLALGYGEVALNLVDAVVLVHSDIVSNVDFRMHEAGLAGVAARRRTGLPKRCLDDLSTGLTTLF